LSVYACGYDVTVFPFGFAVTSRTSRLAKTKFAATRRTKTGDERDRTANP
jgi:hypothetical protein